MNAFHGAGLSLQSPLYEKILHFVQHDNGIWAFLILLCVLTDWADEH
jgi:hypothetical protein